MSRTGHALDGVAVVSEIMASPVPIEAAQGMKGILNRFKEGHTSIPSQNPANPGGESIIEGVCILIEEVRKSSPLIHQVTSLLRQGYPIEVLITW